MIGELPPRVLFLDCAQNNLRAPGFPSILLKRICSPRVTVSSNFSTRRASLSKLSLRITCSASTPFSRDFFRASNFSTFSYGFIDFALKTLKFFGAVYKIFRANFFCISIVVSLAMGGQGNYIIGVNLPRSF
jgi:hypothetical protein